MDFEFANDGFLPYESFDYIYKDRKLPEFGDVKSPYVRELSTWKFFLANGEGEVPFGFESASFDDSDWDLINAPSTWQTEGYGLPNNLLYNYPEELEKITKRGEESISDKFLVHSTNADSDELGIYRTSVVFSPEDIDRALYLETSGICGNFNVYLNGELQSESHSVLTRKRILLSGSARPGVNQLTIIVSRWDRDKNGKIVKELMNFGFSGIFRPVYIVAESLLEISNLHLKISNVPAAYVDQLALTDPNSSDLTVHDPNQLTKITRGNYNVKADFRIRNHTDYMMPYSVRVSVLEARSEYDPYKLPYAKINEQALVSGTIDSRSDTRETSEFVAIDVAQWTDATPVQYDIIFELLDTENRVICVKKRRFGFRSTEIVMDKFNINDKTLPLKLVKYYEFDPQGGITVPLDRFRQDIMLMKRAGINGIITQGFPLSENMLNLCDEYGIYVIASCDRRFMADFVEHAMNHPSVIMYGFNDWHFDAIECGKVKSKLLVTDDTRPWYCTSDVAKKVSDLTPFPNEAGVIFGPWQDLCLDRKSIFEKNKFDRNLFETIPGRTRFPDDGADYKWIHHADLVGGKNKENSSIGQGIVDADRNPHPVYADIRKQCESISVFASPDDATTLTMRNTHPFAYTPELVLEWKVLLGGNTIMSGKGNVNEIEPYGMRTLRFPLNIQKYLDDGWAEGRPELIEMYINSLSHEIVFDISLKLAKNTYYAQEGFEIAFYQDVLSAQSGNPAVTDPSLASKPRDSAERLIGSSILSEGKKIVPAIEGPVADGVLTVMDETNIPEEIMIADAVNIPEEFSAEETDVSELIKGFNIEALPRALQVGNDDMKISFSRDTGAVCGIRIGDTEFLKGSFKPSFYRCPSNIDRTDRSFILAKTIFSKESDYEQIQKSIEFVGCNYGLKNDVFTFISRYRSFAMKGEIIVAYEVPASDTLRITLTFTPKYDMVRYGLRVPINRDNILCTWYGRGPGESYYDRKNATRLGVYSAGVDKIYHAYARPAENSSHTDTEAMQLVSSKGDLIRFTRNGSLNENMEGPKFEFTVLPFTPEQMNESLHEELLMQNDFCELFLDFCSKEIERTSTNSTSLPLKKNVTYKETMDIKFIGRNG
jgi:hypothetical protein